MYAYLTNSHIDDLNYLLIVINMNDPNDHATINKLTDALQLASTSSFIVKTYEEDESTEKIKTILDKVFYGLISVTMFLCFFSLSASMSANLYE